MNNTTEQQESINRLIIHALAILYGLEMTTVVIYNILLIVSIMKTKTLRVQENMYLIHLLCWDFISGCNGLISLCLWYSQPNLCLVSCVIRHSSGGGTLAALSLAMMEKYTKICHPFHYVRIFSKWNSVAMMVVCDIIAVIFFISVNINSNLVEARLNRYCICANTNGGPLQVVSYAFSMIVVVCNALMSVSIVREAHKHRRQIQVQAASVRATQQKQHLSRGKLLSFLSLFTFTSFIPTACIYIYTHVNGSITHREDLNFLIGLVSYIVVGCNNWIDPLAFYIVTPALQNALKKTLRCTWFAIVLSFGYFDHGRNNIRRMWQVPENLQCL